MRCRSPPPTLQAGPLARGASSLSSACLPPQGPQAQGSFSLAPEQAAMSLQDCTIMACQESPRAAGPRAAEPALRPRSRVERARGKGEAAPPTLPWSHISACPPAGATGSSAGLSEWVPGAEALNKLGCVHLDWEEAPTVPQASTANKQPARLLRPQPLSQPSALMPSPPRVPPHPWPCPSRHAPTPPYQAWGQRAPQMRLGWAACCSGRMHPLVLDSLPASPDACPSSAHAPCQRLTCLPRVGSASPRLVPPWSWP